MAQSLFKLLAMRQPGVAIDVLAPEWSLPIVARMPEIRCGIGAQTGHGEFGFDKRRRIAASLREHDYERAIVLPRSFKAALIPWLARIPRRTGFRGEMRFGLINDLRPFDKSVLDQTVKRFAALGLPRGEALPGSLPFPELDISSDNQRRVIAALGVSTARPVIAMMPGAEYGPAKCWPLEHFTALAAKLDAAGYAVWVLGSQKDAPSGAAIAAGSAALNLCGRTSLEDVIDLLAACEQAVSNDSGLMHVAAATGTRVHGIYGSSSAKFTPPLTKSREIHELSLDCRPCFERECPLEHLDCLRRLDPDPVFEKIVAKNN
jgi:heptosyltransferase-2